MRNSKIKLAITTIFLAGTIGTFSIFAHGGEGKGMMSSQGMQEMGGMTSSEGTQGMGGMMSSEGMQGMGGMMEMMNMMSDMSPEDRKAMTDTCMKMMQSHGGDHMDGGMNGKDADAS
jgi:hypothetical protein